MLHVSKRFYPKLYVTETAPEDQFLNGDVTTAGDLQRINMIPCPSIVTHTHIRRIATTRCTYRHQMAALMLCLCVTSDLLRLVHCGVVRPDAVTTETVREYVTGNLIGGATEQGPTSVPAMGVKSLWRTINNNLNSAWQGLAFRIRLLHKCVEWKYKSAPHEVGNKRLQGRTFRSDTGSGHVISKDTSTGARLRTYSGLPGRKQYKLSYRQTRNVIFPWNIRSRGRSKRAANEEQPAAMATDTYDAQGVTLTPRTFYTFYNKSAAKFTRDEQLVPMMTTTPTNGPPSPPMLRTSGLSEWKTVSLEKAKTHSNGPPPSDSVDGPSLVTSIQSPASVATTTDMQQMTTPLSVVENETPAVTQQENWTTELVTKEMSMVNSTVSPLDGSTNDRVSTTTQSITEAELIDTFNAQNSTNTFSPQNTTDTVTDEPLSHTSTTSVSTNMTTTDTPVSTQSESLRKDYTTTATTTTQTVTIFDNYTLTTSQKHDVIHDNNNNISSSSTTSATATTKQTTTTTTTITSPTSTTTHDATTETTKTSHTITATVTGQLTTTEATTTRQQQQHTRSTTITPIATQFPLATTRSARNVTDTSRGHLASTTIAGITTGSLAIFWLFLGPLVCLICHLKDREKNRRQRQKEDELGHRLVNELIRSELAKGRGKLYKTEVRDDRELEHLPPGTNGTGPVGPVCVTVV